jgi:hypothetical protein
LKVASFGGVTRLQLLTLHNDVIVTNVSDDTRWPAGRQNAKNRCSTETSGGGVSILEHFGKTAAE